MSNLELMMSLAHQVVERASSHEEVDLIGNAILQLSARMLATGTHMDDVAKAAWIEKCSKVWDSAVIDAVEFAATVSPGGTA